MTHNIKKRTLKKIINETKTKKLLNKLRKIKLYLPNKQTSLCVCVCVYIL